MQYKRCATIAVALAAIATNMVDAKNHKPFMSRNKNGFAICRNVGAAPKVTVCVSGKPGTGRVSDAAIKSAVLSIKKMALVYGAKYSTLSSNQVSKFQEIAPGNEPPLESEISTSSTSSSSEPEADSSSDEPYVDLMSQPEAGADEMPESGDNLPMEEPVDAVADDMPMEEPVDAVVDDVPMEESEDEYLTRLYP